MFYANRCESHTLGLRCMLTHAMPQRLAFSKASDSGCVTTIAPQGLTAPRRFDKASGGTHRTLRPCAIRANRPHSNKLTRDCPSVNKERAYNMGCFGGVDISKPICHSGADDNQNPDRRPTACRFRSCGMTGLIFVRHPQA